MDRFYCLYVFYVVVFYKLALQHGRFVPASHTSGIKSFPWHPTSLFTGRFPLSKYSLSFNDAVRVLVDPQSLALANEGGLGGVAKVRVTTEIKSLRCCKSIKIALFISA